MKNRFAVVLGFEVVVLLLFLAASNRWPASAAVGPVRTMRVDFYHTGNARAERFSLDRVVLEPLPWPGHPMRPVDDTNRGKYFFEIVDAASGRILYSRGFSSIYGEWETTGEAQKIDRTFSESFRFPAPAAPVRVVIKKRDAKNAFRDAWTLPSIPRTSSCCATWRPRLPGRLSSCTRAAIR